MHNRIYVHIFCRSSRDLAFPDKTLQGVRGKSGRWKTFGFFSTNFHLRFPFVFHRLFHLSKEQKLGKSNFLPRWRRLLSFEEVYFIFLFNALKSIKNRPYIQKYNWKDNWVISSRFMAIFFNISKLLRYNNNWYILLITYLVVMPTKTYTSLVSTLS